MFPVGIEEAWDFISSPKNLKRITPHYLGFEITSGYEEEVMYPGMIISYIVKPVLGIPINWVTEITHIEDKKYFVDEQRFGPYKFWHHKHFLEETSNGVQMIDLVHYGIPMGPLGVLANKFLIRDQLEEIFRYRFEALEGIFGKSNSVNDSKKIIIRDIG